MDDRPTLPQRAAAVLATGFGAGLSPIAPGTAGSVVGVALFIPMRDWPLGWQVAATLVLFALGVLGLLAGFGGVVTVFLDPARRAVHDRLLRTRVVKG